MKLVSLFNPVNLPSDPETSNDGDLYYNTTSGNYRLKLNGVWTNLVVDNNLKFFISPEIFIVGSFETASATLTLDQTHSENIINCLSASFTQIVIPNQDNVTINTGSRISIVRGGEGTVEIVAEDGGVSFSPPSNIYLTKTGTEVKLVNIGYNQWILTGEFPDLY